MFAGTLQHTDVRFQIDNTTAVVHVNAQGGKKHELNEIARDMWNWAIERNLWLSAVHVPGVDNEEANRASRLKYAVETEWSLHQEVFNRLEKRLEPFDLDLFPTRLNNKCEKFFAWKPDPEAFAIDALAHNWHGSNAYAFPPFRLIPHVIQKVTLDRADVTLLAPQWPTQPWFAPVLRPLISPLVMRPSGQGLLHLP